MVKRSIAEIIGTFALVFCGTGAIIIDKQTGGAVSHAGIAVTFGLIVMAMIYGLGEISGAVRPPVMAAAYATRSATKALATRPCSESAAIA